LISTIGTALVACDQKAEVASAFNTRSQGAAEPAPMVAGAPFQDGDTQARKDGESYTYDHSMTVSMASSFIRARFERARDRCEADAALKCKVTSASYRILGEPGAPLPVASLGVALPHDAVLPFTESLTAPLEGEDPGDVVVIARQTTSQNVTAQVRDIGSRLAQLENYRDRMKALGQRRNASTEDLIRIEAELSRTQSEIEQAEAQKRDLADRIARENLTISFEARSTASDALQPVRDVWQSSLRLLADSTASMLGFVVALLPWIPLGAVVVVAGRWLWRRTRKA
jgi:hypothetical protein